MTGVPFTVTVITSLGERAAGSAPIVISRDAPRVNSFTVWRPTVTVAVDPAAGSAIMPTIAWAPGSTTYWLPARVVAPTCTATVSGAVL